MASDESVNLNNELHDQELDVCGKVKALLNARHEVICGKPIKLHHASVDDVDLTDILDEEGTPQVRPNKTLKDKETSIKKTIDEIRELKQTSESQMNFSVDENDDDEVTKAMLDIRQLSTKLLKKMFDVQKEFNEHLNDNLVEYAENKNHIKNHIKLVEDTCKFDRGREAVIDCKEEKFKKSVKKDLKIESVDEFENVCNELAQGVLSTVYKAGAENFKNHNHLLAIKQHNKPLVEMTVESIETAGRLDPFTQQPISKPVHNKVCRHVYDHDSVSQMFQHKLFIACPYIGCANKHFTKKDIVFDLNTSSNSNE